MASRISSLCRLPPLRARAASWSRCRLVRYICVRIMSTTCDVYIRIIHHLTNSPLWPKLCFPHTCRIEAIADDAMRTNWLTPITWLCAILLLPACSMQAGRGPLTRLCLPSSRPTPDGSSLRPHQAVDPSFHHQDRGAYRGSVGQILPVLRSPQVRAISMACADSLDGPWTEFKANPVITGQSAPAIRWIEEQGELHMKGTQETLEPRCGPVETGFTSSIGARASLRRTSARATPLTPESMPGSTAARTNNRTTSL